MNESMKDKTSAENSTQDTRSVNASAIPSDVYLLSHTHSQFLQVMNNQFPTGSLDDSSTSRGGVVGLSFTKGNSLGHSVWVEGKTKRD